MLCLWKLGCGECWQTAVVLIPVTLYILVFDVSGCYVQQCCVYGRIGCGECWQTAVVLIPVTLYILVFGV